MTDVSLPFMNSTGLVNKILDKIIDAQVPARFTQDHLSKLGYTSGSAKAFIPLLKRIGFLTTDGTPTDIYREFRSTSSRAGAMAKAIKKGYAALFEVNENIYKQDKAKLREAIIQLTGLDRSSSTVTAIAGTFEALKAYTNNQSFDVNTQATSIDSEIAPRLPDIPQRPVNDHDTHETNIRKMSLSYTINLNLPETKDPEVFNAIFRSLKENLLK